MGPNEALKKQMAAAEMVLSMHDFETTYINGHLWAAPKHRASLPETFLVVGYGTSNPKFKVELKQIIRFHRGPKGYPVLNNIRPSIYDCVKHTRVARVNVKDWDPKVLARVGGKTPTTKKELKSLVESLGHYFNAARSLATDEIRKQISLDGWKPEGIVDDDDMDCPMDSAEDKVSNSHPSSSGDTDAVVDIDDDEVC